MTLKSIAFYVMVAVVAVEFALAGATKLTPSSGWARLFAGWGYPWWARYAVGILEIAAALALLIPRARAWACGLLLAIMVAAAATHFTHGEPQRIALNAALAALLVVISRRSRGSRSA